jgi:hypothetical protein
MVDVDDPEMPAKVNASWMRMASEYGVLDDRREFLLSVNYRSVGGCRSSTSAGAIIV